MTSYSFIPSQRLVRVTFKIPLSFPPQIAKKFFPERDILMDENGEWLALFCSAQEWWTYLNTSLYELCSKPETYDSTHPLWRMREDYLDFVLAVRSSAFWRPDRRDD